MPSYKVKVKWGRETYTDVVVNTDESPMLFKAKIFALTGVKPERQKIMARGARMKDTNWDNFKLKDGIVVLMMGSKEEDICKEPPFEKIMFVEDMTISELASALDLPAGLSNSGNTCYMNATVQCLRTVFELREGLHSYSGAPVPIVPAHSITAALRDLYADMDKGTTVPPILLLSVLQMAFPRFAERSEFGAYAQQDANECWTELVRMLQQQLPAKPNLTAESLNYKSLIDQYFGGTFEVELKCNESEDEQVTKCKEQFLQLSCFISQDVRYMRTGLLSKMQEQITKLSQTLQKDAVFTKTSKICRLPAYLTVQFVRFYFKEKEGINAKILKDVKFPMEYDAYELCSTELQEKLYPMREKFKEMEDVSVEAATDINSTAAGRSAGDSLEMPKIAPYWFEEDLGSNNSGYYTLQAVLTHRGRSSASGHYVAWIKQSGDIWIKCDDDTVTAVAAEDILKLSGGGDWHCAYVLLYGPKLLEFVEEDSDE